MGWRRIGPRLGTVICTTEYPFVDLLATTATLRSTEISLLNHLRPAPVFTSELKEIADSNAFRQSLDVERVRIWDNKRVPPTSRYATGKNAHPEVAEKIIAESIGRSACE